MHFSQQKTTLNNREMAMTRQEIKTEVETSNYKNEILALVDAVHGMGGQFANNGLDFSGVSSSIYLTFFLAIEVDGEEEEEVFEVRFSDHDAKRYYGHDWSYKNWLSAEKNLSLMIEKKTEEF